MNNKLTIFDIINILLVTLFALVCVYPFYYLIMYSLSDSISAAKGQAWLLPSQLNFSNYKEVLFHKTIINAFFISASRAVIGTLITVICSSFFAFLLSKQEMPFRSTVYKMLIITMYLNAGLIPYYIIMKAYGFNNNFLLYIIPSAISAFYIVLIKTYIEQLPESLNEAAKIDGASLIRIYWQIIMPICMPVLATVAIYSAVGQWNSWQDNLYLVRDKNLKTLQLQLLQYLQSMDLTIINNISDASSKAQKVSTMSVKATMAVITVLPILIVYPFMQRYFIKGILIGAIKG